MTFQHGGHLTKDLYGAVAPVLSAGASIYSPAYGCIGYWPLNDASGAATFLDYSSYGYNGTPTNVIFEAVTAPDGSSPAPDYNGANAYGAVTSAALMSVLPGVRGTAAIWCKVEAAAWSDGVLRRAMRLLVDGTHYIELSMPIAAGQLYWGCRFSVTKFVAISGQSTTQWFHMAITWDTDLGEMKAYLNGVQQGSTQTSLPAQAGPTASVRIGDQSGLWDGNLADAAVWNRVLTQPQLAGIYRHP